MVISARGLFSPILVALILVAALIPTSPVEAGILSFFERVTGKSVYARSLESAYVPYRESYLVAALNSDLAQSQGGGEVLIDDDALVPTVTPDGSSVGEARYSNDQIVSYTVKEGDNLSIIADLHGVKVNSIRWSNEFKYGDTIHAGQVLYIMPINGVKVEIKKGDTVASLAKKYQGDIDEILSYNNIPADAALAVGDSVVIPDGVGAVSSGSTRSLASATSKGPSLPGYFDHPCPVCRKTQHTHGNNGTDWAASVGTPVHAAASGNVMITRPSGWNGGYGKYTVIRHANQTQTLYAHLNEIVVSPGAWVKKGAIIAYLGNTGRSTGPHLHFEVRGAKNPF